MKGQALKVWHSYIKPSSFLSLRPKFAYDSVQQTPLSRNLRYLPLAALLCTTALTGCVGSSVSNALDTAVISPPAEQLNLEDPATENGTQLAATTLGAVPVPVRSPLAESTDSTSETALLADEAPSPVETAATQVLNTPVTPPAIATEQTPAEETTQLASLETDPNSVKEPVATSEVSTPLVAAPTPEASQPQKPKSLFEMWFGKKKAKPANKVVETSSQTVVASVSPASPSGSSSTSGLPGVQRNSAIFGINEEEAEEENDNSVRVASVGSLGRIMSPKGLILQTERVQVDCLKPELLQILGVVERRYGKKVMVTSGYRSPKGNRRAGGARNSTHIYCKAADIQVEGVSKWDLAKFLRTVPGRGGVGTYCRTESVHIDVGSQRDWHHPCRRSKKKKRA